CSALSLLLFSLSRTRPPPSSPLFPYTTLFRSSRARNAVRCVRQGHASCLPPNRADRYRKASLPGNAAAKDTRLCIGRRDIDPSRSEEHTSELQSLTNLVCRLLLEKKNTHTIRH